MSPKKIIFFALLGVIGLGFLVGALYLGNQENTPVQVPKTMKIWISEGTTESYSEIIEGFKKYAPEYAKTNIVIEKKSTDPLRYRTLLLSTMADGTGPDIFMVPAGEDDILLSKAEPVPASILPIKDFDKRYDDIFLSLMYNTGSTEKQETYYLGVPLGYETLGVFYNKNLIKIVPKTWNELDTLYSAGDISEAYPTNLGLAAKYVPNISELLGLFLVQDGARGYTEIKNSHEGFKKYFAYAELGTDQQSTDSYTPKISLSNEIEGMDTNKLTTLDLFMQGKIRMVLGYPSLIQELEKAQKRIGSSANGVVVLTEKTPIDSLGKSGINLAKYSFFAISKGSSNPYIGAKFLEYLSTPDAERIYLKHNTDKIAAQHEFYEAQRGQALSSVFARATMDAFLPESNTELYVFDYGLKTDFDRFLNESIDRNENIDINNISSSLQQGIGCSLATYTNTDGGADCDKK